MILMDIDEFEQNKIVEELDHSRLIDFEYVLERVGKVPSDLQYVGEKFRNCKEIIMKAISFNSLEALNYATDRLKGDRDVILAAIYNEKCFHFASDELKNDRQFNLEVVKRNGRVLEFVHPDFKNDIEIVKCSFQKYGTNFRYASDEVRSDRDLCLYAANYGGNEILKYCSKELQNDREFVLSVITKWSDNFQYCDRKFHSDKEIVIRAICDGRSSNFEYLIERSISPFKNDKEISFLAVSSNGHNIRVVSEEFKNDKTFVLASCENSTMTFEWVDDRLQKDRKFMRRCLANGGRTLCSTNKKIRNDKSLVKVAVRNYGEALDDASKRLQNDKSVVMEAMLNTPIALMFASKSMRKNKKFLLKVLRKRRELNVPLCQSPLEDIEINGIEDDRDFILEIINGRCDNVLMGVSDRLKDDRDLVLQAVKKDGGCLFDASERLKNDPEIALEAIKNNGQAIHCTEFRNSKKHILIAARSNGTILSEIDLEFRNDPEVVIAAMNSKAGVLRYASEEIKRNKEVIVAGVSKRFSKSENVNQEEEDEEEEGEGDEKSNFNIIYDMDWINEFGAFRYINEKVLKENERYLLLQCIKFYPRDIIFASLELLEDSDFIKEALSVNGICLKFLGLKIRGNVEFVKVAVKQNLKAFQYGTESVKKQIKL